MGDEHWDDSLITKEEQEARMQRKMEAVIKRERAMAYAYSNQVIISDFQFLKIEVLTRFEQSVMESDTEISSNRSDGHPIRRISMVVELVRTSTSGR